MRRSIRNLLALVVMAVMALGLATGTVFAQDESESQSAYAAAAEQTTVYRLYHRITREHLYTADENERNTLVNLSGWKDEGKAWTSDPSGEPIYRLYHPGTNDHVYTSDQNEVNVLTGEKGWAADNGGNPVFFSSGDVPVYRLYNPNSRQHLLTTDENEYSILASQGWNQEGIAFRAVEKFDPQPAERVVAQPGVRTVQNFLATAMQPVGSTLYVWGGGWNEPDDAAGRGALTIGVLPDWAIFFMEHDASYDYNTTRHQIYNGLDCSGFVGWSVYNLLNTQSGDASKGEVYYADEQAEIFANKGYGYYTPMGRIDEFRPGDVVSLENGGHVYICVGQCPDGSVVLVHASPPGVMITGTKGPNGEQTQATQLSHQYMSKYYPEYYARYHDKLDRDYSYITGAAKMSWGENFVGDPDGIRLNDAAGVLKILFNE